MIPNIPRDAWPDHPRFPQQTLLLGSHDAFRKQSDTIIEALASLGPDEDKKRRRWTARLSTTFDWWMSGMRGHERYEENKLYPYLAHRYDHSFADLEAGHGVLRDHKLAVQQAFRDGALAPLIAALQAHRDALREHLRAEEDTVIPMLLAMAPEEFERYTLNPISALVPSPATQGDEPE